MSNVDMRWSARHRRNRADLQRALQEHFEVGCSVLTMGSMGLFGVESAALSERKFHDACRRLEELDLELSQLEHERRILDDELRGSALLMCALSALVVLVSMVLHRAWIAAGPMLALYVLASTSAGFLLNARSLRPYRGPRAVSRAASR